MNAQVSTKVTINATPAHVFTFINHLEYQSVWDPRIDTISPEQGELKKGSQYSSTGTMFGVSVKSTHTVSVCKPPSEIQFENITGLLHCSSNYRLTGKSGRTSLICATELNTDNLLFELAQPMLKKVARSQLQVDLRALKRLAEQKHR